MQNFQLQPPSAGDDDQATQATRRNNNTLGMVPESSKLLKLHMKATNETFGGLTRNGASVPTNMMAHAASRRMKRQDSNNTDASVGTMPRNVTVQGALGTAGDNGRSGDGDGGANASWELAPVARSEFARDPLTSSAIGPTNENPLLAMMARNQTISTNENPLLAMMARNQTISTQQQQQSKMGQQPPQPSSIMHNYSIGDEIPKSFMTHLEHSEMKMALLVSKLKPGDTAFVKRSSGKYYSYSEVTNRDRTSISFAVNSNYDTKTFDLLNAGKYVRIMDEEEMEYVGRMTGAAARAEEETIGLEQDEISMGDEEEMEYVGRMTEAAARVEEATIRLEQDEISMGGESNDGASLNRSLIILPACAITSSSIGSSPDNNEENNSSAAAAAEEAVEHKAEEEKPVMYEAGTSVRYRGAGGEMGARILDAHLDDELVPYYTIKLEDGREKQTDNAHLSPLEQ